MNSVNKLNDLVKQQYIYIFRGFNHFFFVFIYLFIFDKMKVTSYKSNPNNNWTQSHISIV